MNEKEDKISETHRNTFEWVLKSQEIQYRGWLESKTQGGLYWVSGKPGSGKSTLMKFLCDHPHTKETLATWAGSESKLIIVSHFFHALGGDEQKSSRGLLRSLLYSILRQCPSMIPAVCLSHVQERYDYGLSDPWFSVDLRETFRKVIQMHELNSWSHGLTPIRICLFVDGLDEHNGNLKDMVKILRCKSVPSHVKMCLSSKPWPTIRDELQVQQSRMLELHTLTSPDIRRFVTDTFSDRGRITHLKEKDQSAFTNLITSIVTKAEGVFFWVSLVVRSLSDGLDNLDDIQDLQKRVDRLPSDLHDYFQYVLGNIDELYREETTQLLRIFLNATGYLPLISLNPILNSKEYNRGNSSEWQSSGWASAANAKLHTRLHARCKDFLFVDTDPRTGDSEGWFGNDTSCAIHRRYRVSFLHATVRDFLTKSQSEERSSIVKRPLEGLISICRCLFHYLSTMPSTYFQTLKDSKAISPWQLEFFNEIGGYIRQVAVRDRRASSQLLDELQRLMIVQCDRPSSFPVGYRHHRSGDTYGEHIGRVDQDILIWVLYQDLITYVDERLPSSSHIVTTENRNKMLGLVTCTELSECIEAGNFESARLRIIHLLLELGAHPSGEIEGSSVHRNSPWYIFVSSLHSADMDLRALSEADRDRIKEIMFIRTKILVQNGADPDCSMRDGIPAYGPTAIEILREYFSPIQFQILECGFHEALEKRVREVFPNEREYFARREYYKSSAFNPRSTSLSTT